MVLIVWVICHLNFCYYLLTHKFADERLNTPQNVEIISCNSRQIPVVYLILCSCSTCVSESAKTVTQVSWVSRQRLNQFLNELPSLLTVHATVSLRSFRLVSKFPPQKAGVTSIEAKSSFDNKKTTPGTTISTTIMVIP